MDWLANEPGAREQLHEWTRLARRAAHRPALSVALALLMGALILHLELRRPPLVAVRAELLVTESDMAFDRRRVSRGDLRAFIEGVALSSRDLVPIMKRYGLWLDELERGPSLAVAEMRKAIEVEIFNDYFATRTRPPVLPASPSPFVIPVRTLRPSWRANWANWSRAPCLLATAIAPITGW
jgi:hypothetical protein